MSSASSSSSTSSSNPSITEPITDEPQQKGKVCFICGSYTIFVVNIREPKHGPNMIDVIEERFHIRPLNDDKYLCYSCNNRLIDWYTKRKQSDDDRDVEDVPCATTSMGTAIGADTSGTINHRDDNSLEMINGTDDDDQENIDVNNIIATMRNRLKKYIYRRHQPSCDDHSDFVIVAADTQIVTYDRTSQVNELICSQQMVDVPKRILCGHCHRRTVRQSNKSHRSSIRRFCRTCRFIMRREQIKSKSRQREAMKPIQNDRRNENGSEAMTKSTTKTTTTIHPTDIVEKLNRLGTSIYYENDCKYCTGHSRTTTTTTTTNVISNAHEIDTIYESKAEMMGVNRFSASESNEILITFDTVVTEVFPIESLHDSINGLHAPSECRNDMSKPNNAEMAIQDILKNVPKSLTITIT